MNKKNRWKVSGLLSGALALLGFAGCSDDKEEDIPVLYGVPVSTVDYRISGTVTDKDGKPLKDIQVIVKNPKAYYYLDENEETYGRDPQTDKLIPDTTYTDQEGKFTTARTIAFNSDSLTVELYDIDGEANGGEFQAKLLTTKKLGEGQIKEKEEYHTRIEYSPTIQLKQTSE